MKKETLSMLMLLLITVACKNSDPEPPLDAKSTLIFQDALAVDNETWISDSTAYHVRKFYQSHYSMEEDSINRGSYSLAPYEMTNAPYSVQVDGALKLANPVATTGYIGIIFNHTDASNYSVFEINNGGTFFVWSNINGTTKVIVPLTECLPFKKQDGAKNTLKLSQNANKIQVRVNNTVIGTYASPMPTGTIHAGVFVGTNNVNVASNVAYLYYSTTTGLFNNFILTAN